MYTFDAVVTSSSMVPNLYPSQNKTYLIKLSGGISCIQFPCPKSINVSLIPREEIQ